MTQKLIPASLLAAAATVALAQPGQAATYVGGGAPFIDFVNTTSTITVTDSFVVQGVTLDLDHIFHSYVGDVEIYLEHAGQSVKLFNHEGQPYGHFVDNLGFDDAAAASIDTYLAGGGVWRPFEPLNAFNGVEAQGDWTIRAFDNAGGDQGSYAGWTLNLAAPAPSADPAGGVPEPASWALMLLGFGAVGAGLRHLRSRGDFPFPAL